MKGRVLIFEADDQNPLALRADNQAAGSHSPAADSGRPECSLLGGDRPPVDDLLASDAGRAALAGTAGLPGATMDELVDVPEPLMEVFASAVADDDVLLDALRRSCR